MTIFIYRGLLIRGVQYLINPEETMLALLRGQSPTPTHVHVLSYLNYSIISVRRYLTERLLYGPPMASPSPRIVL